MATDRVGNESRLTWPDGCPPVVWLLDDIPEGDFRVLADMLAFGWYKRPTCSSGAGIWEAYIYPSPMAIAVMEIAQDRSPFPWLTDEGHWNPWWNSVGGGDPQLACVVSTPADVEDYLTRQNIKGWHYAYQLVPAVKGAIVPVLDTPLNRKWRDLPWPSIALAMLAD